MNSIYKFLIIAAVFSACTNLEDEMYDRIPIEKFPENPLQASLLTVPMYNPLQRILDDGSGWWYCQEVTSDEIVFPTRGAHWDDGGKWRALFEHNWVRTTPATAAMWGPFYEGIGVANELLEGFDMESTDPEVLSAIAKVKIMRAYYYYLLMDNYGDIPYVTSFSDAPKFPEETPRGILVNLLIEEVEANLPNLRKGSKSEVNRGMAFALLAKLYINSEVYTGTAQWAKAEVACDSVLAQGYVLESDPLAPFVTENENSTENIFTIPFDEISFTGFNLHRRTLHYLNQQTFDMTVDTWNGCAVTFDHYNSYEDNDLRKINGFLIGTQYSSTGELLFDSEANANLEFDPYIPALKMENVNYTQKEIRMSGARMVKFEIKIGARDHLSNDFPLFRLADVMLMKAECMLRQGKPAADALEYVNPLRARAGIDEWEAGDLTLDNILAERGREMFFEGHRRQDLIRFGKFLDARWEKTLSTADRLIFPIPQSALDANPNLD